MPRMLLIVLLLSFSMPALAVYKCEAGGTASYSDTPCPGGTIIDTGNTAPANADRQQAEQQLAQNKTEAERLRRERQRREAAEERQQRQLARAHAARQKKCAALALRQHWAEEDARQATGKAAPKAERKARRAAEKHALECRQ